MSHFLTGNADDSLDFHNQMQFTTKDDDNDANDGVNCATRWKGAWWYEDCYRSNLNGLYLDAGPERCRRYCMALSFTEKDGDENSSKPILKCTTIEKINIHLLLLRSNYIYIATKTNNLSPKIRVF